MAPAPPRRTSCSRSCAGRWGRAARRMQEACDEWRGAPTCSPALLALALLAGGEARPGGRSPGAAVHQRRRDRPRRRARHRRRQAGARSAGVGLRAVRQRRPPDGERRRVRTAAERDPGARHERERGRCAPGGPAARQPDGPRRPPGRRPRRARDVQPPGGARGRPDRRTSRRVGSVVDRPRSAAERRRSSTAPTPR